jgi:hypothetical protein
VLPLVQKSENSQNPSLLKRAKPSTAQVWRSRSITISVLAAGGEAYGGRKLVEHLLEP